MKMRRNRDIELDYEHLGRYVFDCYGKGCDPFKVADADLAQEYFRGTPRGKKNMSIIIDKLLTEAQRKGMSDYVVSLKSLHDRVWSIRDNSKAKTYSANEAKVLMNDIADTAELIIGSGVAYE